MTVDRQRAPRVRDRKSAPKAPRINLGPTSMERAARVAAAGIVPVRVPTIPPSDPDADILNGYADAMSLRAAGYAEATDPSEEQAAAESRVWCGTPTTIAGVIARMALQVPEHDNRRWLDVLLCNSGIGALVGRKLDLNDEARHVAEDIGALIRIDWEQALAAYDAEEGALSNLLTLEAAIEAERDGIDKAVYDRLSAAMERAEEQHHRTASATARLIRTLTPDGRAFQEKMRIAGEESQFDWVGTVDYFDRDFTHVMGRCAAADQAEG